MRVAMITDYSGAPDRVDGGVQAVTRYLVDALAKLEAVDLHVISFDYKRRSAVSSEATGYTTHTLPGSGLGTLTAFRRNQMALDACLGRLHPDVVHGQGAGHNGILASRSSFPSVVTVHGIMAEEAKFYVGLGKQLRHRLLAKWSDLYCIRRGRHTILISPYVADYFSTRLCGQQYLIPNPIAEEFFEVQRQEDATRILFAGRLYALKGVIELIRATATVAQHREINLVLAGSMEDHDYVAQLRMEAARLGITDRIAFRGLLSEVELRDELARAALLVLPSYQETAPMVIVEAMAAGVPVVATNVGGISRQIEHGVTGLLVNPGDVEALSRALLRLLSDDELRRSAGRAAKEAALDEYRAANVANRTVDVYRNVISKHA